jgi:hypothetical protein
LWIVRERELEGEGGSRVAERTGAERRRNEGASRCREGVKRRGGRRGEGS